VEQYSKHVKMDVMDSSTAPRRPRRSDALSSDKIVRAAIDILDKEGEEALTFRTLATALKTGPGGIYESWTAAGCSSVPEAGESSSCPGLRDSRNELRAQGFAANKVVIGSLVLVGVGAAIIIAGLGSYLYGRKLQRRQRAQLHILPAPGGLAITGRF
jgi:hypothetical protein